MRKIEKAFTLIELLVVMAILAVLAVIVLVLINPTDKIAMANDTGRISAVSQLGHAVSAYFTSQEGNYPDPTNWSSALTDTGNPVVFPSGIRYLTATGVTSCTSNAQPATNSTYCYDLDSAGSNGAIVFSKLEAASKLSLCTSPQVPYFVYSLADGRGGTVCSENDPTPWPAGSQAYVQ